MKHIIKGQEPQELIDYKDKANENWKPNFKELDKEMKQVLYQDLMKEQGYLCCYCESRLENNNYHIEHLQPKSDPTVDPLDYSNLLCSCQRNLQKGEPRHCGNLKGDSILPISPLDPNCESYFTFNFDGKIKASQKDDQAAKDTIKILGLDIPKLQAMRKAAIEPFLNEEISNEDLKIFIKDYLSQDSQGRYGEFWTTIHDLFSDII
jgi:uncharacterized protein (TIGR02646 family)